MLLTRQNPRGGPALTSFPIYEDKSTGTLGYKIGYCGCGCGEEIGIRTIDVRRVVAEFGFSLEEYEDMLKSKKQKLPLRHRLIRLLGGSVDD